MVTETAHCTQLSLTASPNTGSITTESQPTETPSEHQWQLGKWKSFLPPTLRWWVVILPLTALVTWSFSWILLGPLALPGGSIFALGILQLMTTVLGFAAEWIGLPPAFGMMMGGLMFKNTPGFIDLAGNLDPEWTNPLRAMSVVVLLTRGAFGVNFEVIKNYKSIIPALYLGCCLMEACAAMAAVYFLLGLPLPWCAAAGCIYSGMSGGITMPYLSTFERKRNEEEGTRVMTIAKEACGLDAIFAIAMTEVAYGFIFRGSQGFVYGLEAGALEVVLGFVFGIASGSIIGIAFLNEPSTILRTFMVFSGGSISLLGLTAVGHPRGGPIGCYFGALATSMIWKHKPNQSNESQPTNLNALWYFFQPLLFGIIGARVDLQTVNWNLIFIAFICLLISLLVRMCTNLVIVSATGRMTVRQRLFMAVAWLPKGTVQAALGPVALETSTSLGVAMGSLPYDLMTIAAMVIVVGTLLGPVCLARFGPSLLIQSGKRHSNL